MRVCFVLPCSGRYPIGGFRVIYEYANRLVARGHNVTLVHLIAPQPGRLSQARFWRARLQFLRDRWTGTFLPRRWFTLDPRVVATCHFDLREAAVPDGDVVIATAWHTAEGVACLRCAAGKKFYFIQHFETWDSDYSSLVETWHLPLQKIVIARWLQDIAREFGQSAEIVPNAIDHDFFRVDVPSESRRPNSILLQCHRLDWKGTKDAIEALESLRRRGVLFQLTLFGMKRPEELGITIDHDFVYNPSQVRLKQLYNENAIFIAPSWTEGWGLTPHEAGACGSALAVTDIGGHREFLVHEETALMSPPKDAGALAANIGRLLADEPLRIRLARQASQDVRRFDWSRSVSRFEQILTDGVSERQSSANIM